MRFLRSMAAVPVLLGILFSEGLGGPGGPAPPPMSVVPNVVYCPSGDFTYRVIVRDGAEVPCPGCSVTIGFSAAADAAICWCAGQVHPSVVALTDAAGRATFLIHAGGCIDPALAPMAFATVTAVCPGFPPVVLAFVGTRTSDPVDAAGLLPTAPGYATGGMCAVGISDATFLTPSFKGSESEPCADLNSGGGAGLADVVLFTPHMKGGHACLE